MSKYDVSEEDFNKAFNNAGPYARQRVLRKLDKKRMRQAEWTPQGISKTYLPPADLEQYVYNFVEEFKDKVKKK